MVTIPVAEIATPNPITLTALITVRVILYLFLFNILKIKDNLLSFFSFSMSLIEIFTFCNVKLTLLPE